MRTNVIIIMVQTYVKVNDTNVKYNQIGEYKLTYILQYGDKKITSSSKISITPSTELTPARPEVPDNGTDNGTDNCTDNGTDVGTDVGTNNGTNNGTDNGTNNDTGTDNSTINGPKIEDTSFFSYISGLILSCTALLGALFLRFKLMM